MFTAAAVSLCGLLSACSGAVDDPEPTDDSDEVNVSVDDGRVAPRRALKVEAIPIKQTISR